MKSGPVSLVVAVLFVTLASGQQKNKIFELYMEAAKEYRNASDNQVVKGSAANDANIADCANENLAFEFVYEYVRPRKCK